MRNFAKLFLVASVFAATPVLAAGSNPWMDGDFGLEVGVRQQSGEPTGTGLSGKSQMGLQFGASAHFQLKDSLFLRTGLLYTQSPIIIETDATGTETKITMNYLQVPIALMYKFEEYAGIYGGIALNLNIDSNVEGAGSVKGIKSPLIPLIFGATFKFAPNFGVNLYYEGASGEVANNPGLENYRAVGANLMISFN